MQMSNLDISKLINIYYLLSKQECLTVLKSKLHNANCNTCIERLRRVRSGTLPYGISKKRLELRKNEKRARSPFFKTNSQDSYRRDGIIEKV
jgi:hypothetical protein